MTQINDNFYGFITYNLGWHSFSNPKLNIQFQAKGNAKFKFKLVYDGGDLSTDDYVEITTSDYQAENICLDITDAMNKNLASFDISWHDGRKPTAETIIKGLTLISANECISSPSVAPSLSPTSKPTSSQDHSKQNLEEKVKEEEEGLSEGALIGIVVGSVVFFLIVVYSVVRHRRKNRNDNTSYNVLSEMSIQIGDLFY